MMVEVIGYIIGIVLLIYFTRRFPLLWWAYLLIALAWIFGW